MGLAIQLNRFSFGESQLSASEIYPLHKERTEECLAKIFDTHGSEVSKKEFPLHLQLRPGKPTLLVNKVNQISLKKSPELKKIDQTVRYYQRTGLLPRTSLTAAEERERIASTRKSVKAVNEASIPGANGNMLAGMRFADDTLSLTRNIMYAIPIFGPNDPIANHLGYYAGIFWTFFALREIDDGFIEYQRSRVIGDGEGKRRAGSRILSGSLMTTASLAYLGGKISKSFFSTPVASGLLGASNVLFGVGSLLAMGISLLGAVRCNRFQTRLGEYLDNPALSKQQKMRGAVQFLKDSITVTPEEKADIAAQIEQKHPDWTQEQKERLLNQKMSDLTEVKVKYLKRRTSNKSLRFILEMADPILEKLNQPNYIAEGMRDATILIHTIQKENKIKMGLYVLGFTAALISFIAMAILVFGSGGTLPFMLYGVAGAIYLAITVYSIAGMLLKRDDDTKLIELSPIQNLSHLAAI